MEGQDLTKGDIKKQLWSLAWPMMLSVFFYTLYNLVDAFWVAKLSPEAIAAVSISQIALFIMVALSMGITVGSGVLMSMDIGAKNIPAAEKILGQSFVLSALAGVVFTAISLIFKNEILTLSGAIGGIFPLAMEYYIITAAGSILFFIMMTIVFAFNAQGDTFTSTKLFAVSTLINIILDPIMIFGWLGFPALGIGGAAYATLISQAVFVILALMALSGKNRMLRFAFKNLSFNWNSVKKVLNIGIPASLTQVISPLGLAALMYITSATFMEAGAAAFSIGFRVEFFAFLPAVGFGVGAMAMIGQNIGAGNKERAEEALRLAFLYGIGAAIAFGVAAILAANLIVGTFTADATVTEYALQYIWIVALSYGFLAASFIEANAFQAIGKSWPGFWIFFVRFIVISIPLAYVLTNVFHFPIAGVWWALALGNVVSAVFGYIWITRALKTIQKSDVPVDAPIPV